MQLSSDERSHRVSLALASLAQFAVLLVVYSVGALALGHEPIGALTALFFTGYALTAIPVDWLADRLGVRYLLIAM